MKYIGLFFIVIGAGVFSYSTTLNPYSNEEEFNDKYQKINLDDDDKSEQYHQLRDAYLTDKYTYEDYGLTFLAAGLGLFIIFLKGWEKLTTPNDKWTIRIIGIIAVIANTVGYPYYLLMQSSRDSYPWWADSIGIALGGFIPIFILGLIWYGINSMSLKLDFQTGVRVESLSNQKINKWYAAVLFITLGYTVYSIVRGDYLFTIYGFLWGYFYLCLLAGRSLPATASNELQKTEQSND